MILFDISLSVTISEEEGEEEGGDSTTEGGEESSEGGDSSSEEGGGDSSSTEGEESKEEKKAKEEPMVKKQLKSAQMWNRRQKMMSLGPRSRNGLMYGGDYGQQEEYLDDPDANFFVSMMEDPVVVIQPGK